MKKLISLILAACMLGGAVVGCGAQPEPAQEPIQSAGQPSAAAPADPPAYDRLTVFTSYPESELPTYFNAFERDTGITIDYIRLSAGEMTTRVLAERANPTASIVYGCTIDNFITLAEEGMLEAYQSPELDNIPAKYHDPDGFYNPVDVSAICFTVNRDWFQENNLEYPKTWDDLLKPEFKGQVSMAHPATSGTSYPIVAALIHQMGEEKAWDYFAKLNQNVRHYTKSAASPPTEVALGEAAIALVFSHDGLKPAAEGYPVEIVFPSDGTPSSVEAVGIIKGGPEKELDNAKLFVDWAMSVRGQELYIDSKSNRIPLNVNASVTEGLTNPDDLAIIAYDPKWAAENKTTFVETFKEKIASADQLS